MKRHETVPVGSKTMINYEDFCKARDSLPERCRKLFTAHVFTKVSQSPSVPFSGWLSSFSPQFRMDKYDRISVFDFFQYFCTTVHLEEVKVHIATYDVDGDGYLEEEDMETYIYEMIPTLPPMKKLKV